MKALTSSLALAIVVITTAFASQPEAQGAALSSVGHHRPGAKVICAHCDRAILENIYYCSKCRGPIGGTCRGYCPK